MSATVAKMKSIPPHLIPALKALKLGGMQESLPLRLEQAQQQRLGYTEFLELLLGDEIEQRANRALASRLGKARLCRGWIRISRQGIPPYVNWECSNCQDSGLIHNWEDSPYDLRPPRRVDEPGLLAIELTDDEHAELRRLQLLDLDSERVVWSAYRDNSRLLLVGTDDDLDNLVGFIAFEANHAEDRRRQRRLDQAIGKLEGALRTFG